MDLPKEPTPQSIPPPTGAVTAPMQRWIGVIILGCILFFIVAGWAISRWAGPSKSLMGPRQEKKAAVDQKNAISRLDEGKEKAYEEGKRDASQGWWNQNRQQSYQPAQINQTAQLTPKQQARQDYEKLLHEAAMTDNMVTSRKEERGIQRTISGGARDSVPSGVSTDPLLAPVSGGNHSPDSSRLDRGTDLSKSATVILAPNVLPEGTDIACTLANQLNGDNTGPMKVQVSNDIPFPRTEEIAIPQGSLFLGEAQKVGGQFQERLAVSFHRLQIGQTAGQIRQINLKAPALDQDGSTALADQVNRHYFGIFGASLLIGAIGGLAQIGNSSYGGYGGIDAETQVRNGISQSTAQSSAQILNRFLNRNPTITIRPGHPVIVHLTENLEIPN